MLPWLLLSVQVFLGLRVALRLARTAQGQRIARADGKRRPTGRVAAIVPVLNERTRLQPCLDGLAAQGSNLLETLVVDGGSDDGTPDLVRIQAARDPRLRLVAAGPAPAGWNGKAANLAAGLARVNPSADWILTIDADVRPEPGLVRALLQFAEDERLTALSAATAQTLSGPAEGVVHPALLATLVYRFGVPGHATTRVREVQANGQCFLVSRKALVGSGGFAGVRGSVCEDVTLARSLVAAGGRVGFYETDGLVSVAMYTGWHDAWRNWTRSLPLRDRFWGLAGPLGLAEVVLVQALPLPLAVLLRRGARAGAAPVLRSAWTVNAGLAAMRLGTLAGMRRAYVVRPWTYWLSPLADLPAALALIASARRRRHIWRGRVVERGETRDESTSKKGEKPDERSPTSYSPFHSRLSSLVSEQPMRIARILLLAHLAALAFGLGGMLIALKRPELWIDSRFGVETFEFGMEYGGSLHMVFGAAAMFAFGVAVVGFGRTAIFFGCATILSAGSELIGTGTGWPFGNYEYLDALGYKLLDRVPFTIPLSWFYMGFACYLLGRAIADNRGLRPVEPWSIGIGVWLLIVWDLVLDPAMAHEDLTIQFWVWHQEGPYFGMPIQNYVGWAATGLLFMGLSRLLWRRGVDPARLAAGFPFVVYAANSAFAMAISADVGLYLPIVLSAVLGVLPALLALPRPSRPASRRAEADPDGGVLRPSPFR